MFQHVYYNTDPLIIKLKRLSVYQKLCNNVISTIIMEKKSITSLPAKGKPKWDWVSVNCNLRTLS